MAKLGEELREFLEEHPGPPDEAPRFSSITIVWWYWGAVLLFAMAVSVSAVGLFAWSIGEDRAVLENRRLLQAHREPLRAISRSSVQAALLVDQSLNLSKVQPSGEAVRSFLSGFVELIEQAEPRPIDIQNETREHAGSDSRDVDKERIIHRCPPHVARRQGRNAHGFDRGFLWCSVKNRPRSERRASGSDSSFQSVVLAVSSRYDLDSVDIRERLRIKQLYSAFVAMTTKLKLPVLQGRLQRPVQAFFVSVEGVFLEASIARNAQRNDANHPLKSWPAASYVQTYFEGGQRSWGDEAATHMTDLYLDFGGHGLVRTYCRAAFLPEGKRLLGVACLDVHVDYHELAKARSREPTSILRLYDRDGGIEDSTSETKGPAQAKARGRALWHHYRTMRTDVYTVVGFHGPNGPQFAGRTAAFLRRELPPPLIEHHGDAVSLPHCQTATEQQFHNRINDICGARGSDADNGRAQAFYAKISERPDGNEYAIVVPRKIRHPMDFALLFAAALFFLGALILLAVGNRSVGLRREQAERGSLLLALQVGVFELDSELRIVAGNQRAEEIFGRPFNTFGQQTRQASFKQPLESCIETGIVMIRDHDGAIIGESEDPADVPRPGYHHLDSNPVLHHNRVANLRKEGRTPRGYMRLKHSRRWVRFALSPIGDEKHGSRTYGIVDVAPPALSDELDDYLSAGFAIEPDALELLDNAREFMDRVRRTAK